MASDRRSDIVFAAALIILLAAAWHIRNVLLLIYVAALFAAVISPTIGVIRSIRIGSWRPSKGVAVLALIVTALAALALTVVFLAPPIVQDAQAFSRDLPNKLTQLLAKARKLPFTDHLNLDRLQQYAMEAVGGAVGLFANIAGGVFGFFTWLILTAYFIVDGERAFHWGLSMIPAAQRPRLEASLKRAEGRVSKWLFGQAILMAILGTAASITYKLLGVKYALALGVFTGIANIVPIIGPVASVALAAMVASFDSWQKAIGVIVFYVIYQQIENAFLTPRIMKSTVDLPALAVVVALAVGGALAGIIGALVAVPTAALLGVLINEYLVKSEQ